MLFNTGKRLFRSNNITSIKLYALLMLMSIVMLVAGAYEINKLKTLNQITGTMFTDRLVPMQQLSMVRKLYGPNMLLTLSKAKEHQITYEQAETQLADFELKANLNWKKYQLTFFTPEETLLVNETNKLMDNVKPTITKLRTILKIKDSVALDSFIKKELNQKIEPIETKIKELKELQLKISREDFRTSGEIYKKTELYIYLILLFYFLLGFYIIKNIKSLSKNLQQSNDEIIRNEKKFREFIKHAGDAIFIINPEYQITEVNEVACTLLNYSSEELQNMKIHDLMTADDQQLFTSRIKIVDQNGVSLHERTLVKKDGSLVDTEVNVRSVEEVGYIAVIRDISQRKESELQFKNLVEKSLVGVYIIQKGKFAYVNPKFASELGYTQEEVLNMNNSRDIVDPEYLPSEVIEWRKKVDMGIIDDFHVELKYKKKDGSSIWAEAYCGETIYKGTKAILGSFQNITQRKNFEVQQLLISSIVNSSNDAIISKSLDGIITSWNKGAEKALGYTQEEMIDQPIFKIIPPHLIDEERHISNNIRAGQSINHYETQRLKKNGELIEVSLTISPIIDSLGKIVGASKILRDITERKKAETIIKEQSETFAAIIENPNESILLLSPDLKVLQFNKTAKERLFLNSGKEIYLGANFKDFLYTESENVFMPMFNTALDGKYPDVESYQKDINGSIFWLRTRMYPVYNTQKKLIGITILAENITERKKVEKNIEQSEERNRSLIENISDTIILINDMLEVVYQSPSYVRTAGFSMEDHKGKTILDIIYSDDVQQGIEIIEKSKSSPATVIPFQMRLFHKKGHFIWIEGTITNLLQNDSVKSYVLNYRDVTFRKMIETERLKITSEILQRNRDLEQFAYIVSHNLRAPVANIMGITAYLKDQDIDENDKKEMSEGLSVSAQALDEIIHDLNTILQTKREISEKKEIIKFSEILNDVKLSIATLIENEKVIFNSDFSEIDEMLTLKSYMYSIFYNLISNSIKYRKPEITPIITISSKLTANKIELFFKDNGLGIDLEKNGEHVFGLYKRFHTDIEGKGMGLYMVKTQVETLGGKISIKSEINKETEFRIKFKIENNNN